ncbi:putative endopeptidase K [Fusarium austroafricanum]|uniref:Putative endopeptidase K n=1 Tax=Fusarium austroafricanum TaxID=2364996 RepID=A0A8H4JKX1_9HYPO|nr:putative endopeptidase K [Fusarium austroafricanum]
MKLSIALFGLAGLVDLVIGQAVIKNDGVDSKEVVPDSYIITYKPSVKASTKKKHEEAITKSAKKKGKEGVVSNVNLDSFQGYIAEIPPSELKQVVDSDLVAYIEKDTVVNSSAVAAPSFGPLTKRAYTTQQRAPWGLARISHVPTAGGFDSGYYYNTAGSSGANVYVLDSGVRITHNEFSGRAVWGANFISGSPNTDEFGHGTHVAGTIGGKTYGVAKNSKIYAVKVLDKTGSGSMSIIIQGLQWAVNDAKARGIANKAIVNMSLGGYYTAAANDAVKAATDAGLTVVVAAGNSNDDSSYYSPASAPSAITVGAVDAVNYRTQWSNYGSPVDIFAPGSGILSSWHLSDSASRYLSGTSMACPHVAGLAAYFVSKEGIKGSAVTQRILKAAIAGKVADPQGSNNRLAYNGGGA